MRMHYDRVARYLIGVLLTMTCFSWSTLAAEKDVEIELSRFVFSQRIANGSWMPIETRVVNRSDKPIDLALVIDLDSATTGAGTVQFRRQIMLPPKASRSVEQYILTDFPAWQLARSFQINEDTVSFKDGSTRTNLRYKTKHIAINVKAFNRKGGQMYGRYEMLGMPLHPDALFLVAADGNADEYHTGETYDLEGLPYVLGEHADDNSARLGMPYKNATAYTQRHKPSAEDLGTGVINGRLSPSDLPYKWAAYEGVDVLVLGSLRNGNSPSTLTPQQRHSLLRWVRSGGRLIVHPSYNPEAYRHPFWSQLLPVQLLENRFATRADMVPLEKRYGGKIEFDPDMPPRLMEAVDGEGTAVLRDGERVLVARRHVGHGEVWFCAVSGAAVEEWSAGHRLWLQMLTVPPSPVPGAKYVLPDTAQWLLGKVVGLPAPSRMMVFLLLGGYLGLTLGAFVVCRRKGRTELAWPVMVLLAVGGLLGALSIGSITRSQVGFAKGEIGLTVLADGGAQGSATGFVGLYSEKQRENDLVWTNPDTLATVLAAGPLAGEGGAAFGNNLVVAQENQFSFTPMLLPPGELFSARTMTMVNYKKGIRLRVGYGSKGVTGYVENRTGQDLQDAILRLNRRTLQIGELKDGQKRDLAECSLAWNLSAADFVASEHEEVRRFILAEALRYPDVGTSRSSRTHYTWPVALYAWGGASQAGLEMGEDTPKDISLQLLVVPAESIDVPKGDVFVPAGACGLRFIGTNSRQVYGDPARLRRARVELPGMARIAGQAAKTRSRASAYGEAMTSEDSIRKNPQQIFGPTGWKTGTGRAHVRVGFDMPQGLERVSWTKLAVVLDLDLNGVEAKLAVRRPGGGKFVPLGKKPIGSGATEIPLSGLKKHLGKGGALPEFQLSFVMPKGSDPLAKVRWQIQTFDIKLWGKASSKRRAGK